MANFETAGVHRLGQFILRLLTNVRVQFALPERIEKCADFIFLSAHLHLDTAINQIAHPASDVETFRNMSHRPAKTDTLDVSLKKYLERDHAEIGRASCRESWKSRLHI